MIYLSGPISSNGKSIEENKAAMAAVEKLLTAKGLNIMNPARLNVPGWNWDDYMNLWRNVVGSDSIKAIAMMPGWEASQGARIEHEIAKRREIPVIYLRKGML